MEGVGEGCGDKWGFQRSTGEIAQMPLRSYQQSLNQEHRLTKLMVGGLWLEVNTSALTVSRRLSKVGPICITSCDNIGK